jgi:hypothetical protein
LQSALSSCTFWVYLFQPANELCSSVDYTSADPIDAGSTDYSTAAVQPAASDADLLHA